MTLTVDFNDITADYKTWALNSFVLGTYYNCNGYSTYCLYDFASRIMITRTADSAGGASITPFNALDYESLETLRQRLIELKGNPPALPALDANIIKKKLTGNNM